MRAPLHLSFFKADWLTDTKGITMSSKNVLPTFTSEGWLKHTPKVFDQMYADFLLSEASQTAYFPMLVASFPDILQRYREDPVRVAENVEISLQRLLTTQFNQVRVDVEAKPIDDSINKIALHMLISMQDVNGEEFTLNSHLTNENNVSQALNTILKG